MASVVYVATVVVGAAITPGYSHTSDFISSLTQSGAPRKVLLDPPFPVHNTLLVAFALGLLAEVRRFEGGRPNAGQVGGFSLLVVGLMGIAMLWSPQDPVGAPVTTRYGDER